MTYPVPDNRITGYTVQAPDWNQLAQNSNDANNRLSVLENLNAGTRLSTLESNLGARGNNQPAFTEIGSLKTRATNLEGRVSTLEDAQYSPASVTLMQSTNQSLANATNVAVGNWQVRGTQIGSMWVAGNTYLTVPADGLYMLSATVVYAADGANGKAGQRVLYFIEGTSHQPTSTGSNVLGSTILTAIESVIGEGGASTSDDAVPLSLAWSGFISAGTQIHLTTWQSSGSAISTRKAWAGQTLFSATRVG